MLLTFTDDSHAGPRVTDRDAAAPARFERVFDHAPVGMLECLPDGTIVHANAAFCRMLGYPVDELVGLPAGRFLSEDSEREQQRADLSRLDSSGPRGPQDYSARRVLRRRDGTLLPVNFWVVVVPGPEGEAPRLLKTCTDASDHVRAEERLDQAGRALLRGQALTDAVLDSLDVGVVACDRDGSVTLSNRTARAWQGDDPDGSPQTLGRDPLSRALADGGVTGAEMVISRGGRPDRLALCTGRTMVCDDGDVLGAVVAMTDITDVRAQQEALRASETRLRVAFDNAPAGLVVVTLDGDVVGANRTLTTMLGSARDEFALPARVEHLVAEADRRPFDRLVDLATDERGAPPSGQLQLLGAAGRLVWCHLTVTVIPDVELGRCLLLQAVDVTERKRAEEELAHQARHDALTGLPNRSCVLSVVQSLLDGGTPDRRAGVYVLFCDLDGFKAVNDQYGHAAGDHLLVEIARRLETVVRPADVVGRLGGDEFLLVFRGVQGLAAARAIATRVEQVVAQPVSWAGREMQVSVSIGIASGEGIDEAEQLMRHADAAMYHAKRLGRVAHRAGRYRHPARARPALLQQPAQAEPPRPTRSRRPGRGPGRGQPASAGPRAACRRAGARGG